jgi:hypothetical protein
MLQPMAEHDGPEHGDDSMNDTSRHARVLRSDGGRDSRTRVLMPPPPQLASHMDHGLQSLTGHGECAVVAGQRATSPLHAWCMKTHDGLRR